MADPREMQNCKTDDDDDDDYGDDDGDYDDDYVDYEVDKGSLLAIFMFNTIQNTRSRKWFVHYISVGSSVALLIARTKHVNCHVVSACAVFLPQFLVLACCAGALFTAEVLCS